MSFRNLIESSLHKLHFRVNAVFRDENNVVHPLDHKLYNLSSAEEAKQTALEKYGKKYKGYEIQSVHQLHEESLTEARWGFKKEPTRSLENVKDICNGFRKSVSREYNNLYTKYKHNVGTSDQYATDMAKMHMSMLLNNVVKTDNPSASISHMNDILSTRFNDDKVAELHRLQDKPHVKILLDNMESYEPTHHINTTVGDSFRDIHKIGK